MLKDTDKVLVPESYRPHSVRVIHKRVESDTTGMDRLMSSNHHLANSARNSLLVKRECSSIVNLTRAIMNKKKNSLRGESVRKRETLSQRLFN
jgi:hypothetical protein